MIHILEHICGICPDSMSHANLMSIFAGCGESLSNMRTMISLAIEYIKKTFTL